MKTITTMKKNLWIMGMMFVALFGFTSCEFELEQAVGFDVSGRWFGDLDMWINGTKCSSSEIEFMPQGWGYSKGRGVQTDYLYSYRVTHYFDYEIIGSTIYLYFDDPSLDCAIRDYRINDNYFTGYMDGKYDSTKFRLKNYEHYYSEFASLCDYFYYAKENTMGDIWDETTDSIKTDSIASEPISTEELHCTRGVNELKK